MYPRTNSLPELFYQAFDAAKVLTFLEKIADAGEFFQPSNAQLLGEGTHFRSYAFPSSPIPLAINVAKTSFLKSGPGAIERWIRSVSKVKHIRDCELIPPMEVVQGYNQLALVMPVGAPIPKATLRTIDRDLFELSKFLGQAGLVLDDYPQIRQAQGVPFIVDWSDLKACPHRAG